MSQMIHRLDDVTINQIAAGEVIENPASVIKELIENSLDAAATEIEVEVIAAGRQLIRVSDNGCGMSKEDALLAIERHATSKLRAVGDLEKIASFGFRGEALASVASISKLRVNTCREEPLAHQVFVEGGKILSCEAAKRSKGTCIEVRSLFFNQPVRQKFMKSLKSDQNEIVKTLRSLNLANPMVSFHLILDGKSALKSKSRKEKSFEENFFERANDLFGKDFYTIDEEQGPCRLFGALAKASLSRKSRSQQELFIQQRKVSCPLIANAVKEGYGATLQNSHFPIFALHLFAPSSHFDVNVHPQKKHLRLLEENFLKTFCKKSVEKKIFGSSNAPSFSRPMPLLETLPWEKKKWERKSSEENSSKESWKEKSCKDDRHTEQENYFYENKQQFQQRFAKTTPKQSQDSFIEENSSLEALFLDANYIYAKKSSSHAVYQLCIINQRAAERRILFENFENQKTSEESIQPLIVPLCMEFSQVEALFIKQELSTLEECGISMRPFGERSFLLEALPSSLDKEQVQTMLIEWTEKPKKNLLEDKKEQLAKSACRLLRSKTLCLEEAQYLIQALLKSKKSQYCPLGKKIMHCLSLEETQSLFS